MQRSTHLFQRGATGLSAHKTYQDYTLAEIRVEMVQKKAKLDRIFRLNQTAERQGADPTYNEQDLFALRQQAQEVFDANNDRDLGRAREAIKTFDHMASQFDPPLELEDSDTPPTSVPPYYEVLPIPGTSVQQLRSNLQAEYGRAPIIGVTEDAVWVRSSVQNVEGVPGVKSTSGSRGLPPEIRDEEGPGAGGNGQNGDGSTGGAETQAGLSAPALLVGAGVATAAIAGLTALSGSS